MPAFPEIVGERRCREPVCFEGAECSNLCSVLWEPFSLLTFWEQPLKLEGACNCKMGEDCMALMISCATGLPTSRDSMQ